ncbi:MAG: sodium:proton antiporter [Bacteroidetes bacterium]|nr:MAG: sodium:proton antiporter [Bacteroidota bacterium]REK03564.1 MAG: sodium:proton antiporter [Bacteroidota bacterium]REK34856.1 MAG: sodium:proton antiporter [Bacteroidota bacterium]REK51225.1 MAG: sodium:proton antiporter [Bacteroidota bacterium]
MDTNTVLIVLSSLAIFSYIFELLAKSTRIPSVLMLLFTGMGIHYLTVYFGIEQPDFSRILPTLGTIGLIMIVFEGALELKFEQSKIKLIRRAFFSALFILLITALTISILFQYMTGEKFSVCFLNAIPYSIISSAIAIPSVASINKEKKEFIIYESSFSDIIGIMVFNFSLNNQIIDFGSFLHLGVDITGILLISAVFCILLLYTLGRLTHHVKFFLIISILLLVYGTGKLLHLSSLVIVLALGLFLSNADQVKHPKFRKVLLYESFGKDMHQLLQISSETAFVLRTFFFVIFGFTIVFTELLVKETLIIAVMVLAIIYIVRLVYFLLMARKDLIPEIFITPRGLISVLLFFSIPDELQIEFLGKNLLFVVILATSLFMTFGLISAKRETK